MDERERDTLGKALYEAMEREWPSPIDPEGIAWANQSGDLRESFRVCAEAVATAVRRADTKRLARLQVAVDDMISATDAVDTLAMMEAFERLKAARREAGEDG